MNPVSQGRVGKGIGLVAKFERQGNSNKTGTSFAPDEVRIW